MAADYVIIAITDFFISQKSRICIASLLWITRRVFIVIIMECMHRLLCYDSRCISHI